MIGALGDVMMKSPTLTALLVLLGLLVSPPAAASPRPTRAALRKTFEMNRRALVEVVGPRRSGAGVIVGAAGQVLTSVDHVGLQEARVRMEGKELSATVLLASAELKIAVLELQPPGEHPSAPVRLQGDLGEGAWLVGIGRSRKGEPVPLLGRVLRAAGKRSRFLEVSTPLAAGAPLFDPQGKLVALSVGSRSRGRGCRALPVSAVKDQLERRATP